ncbi:Uncharacterised protein [Weissella viridescens]|uniref:Uncharacterized protein n=1 Tax=Weissella viridescens TaxID=1629 RepID=A0A380P8F5_WEIVI|nr:Uncharacterised protein [Weissella viridescens]
MDQLKRAHLSIDQDRILMTDDDLLGQLKNWFKYRHTGKLMVKKIL